MNEVQLTQKLVRINSENPPGNEKEVAKFIYKYLKKIGLKPKLMKIKGNRYNVVASIGTKGPGLMLNGHMDTVPIGKGWNGLSGKIKSGKLYGRGSGDMKSGIAVILTSVKNILKTKPKFKKKLLLTFVADEEVKQIGTDYLLKKKKSLFKNIKYGVVGECSSMEVWKGQKGIVDLKIFFKGKSAHGSTPHLGDSAILKATKFINALDKIKKRKGVLGKPTYNVGIIKGGTKVNMVPDYCELELDRRLIDKENASKAIKQLKLLLKKLKINAEIKTVVGRNPMLLSEKSKLLDFFKNNKIKISTSLAYTEVEMYYSQAKIEAVNFGPGPMKTAHIKDEWVKVKDIKKATKIYEKLIKEFCL